MINTHTHTQLLLFRTIWQTTPNSFTTNFVISVETWQDWPQKAKRKTKMWSTCIHCNTPLKQSVMRRKADAVSKTTDRIAQNWSTVQLEYCTTGVLYNRAHTLSLKKMIRVMQLAFPQAGYYRIPNSTHKVTRLTCQSFQTTQKRCFLQLGHCVLLRPCVT